LPAPYLNLAQIALRRNQPREALEILNRAQSIRAMSISYLFHFTLGDVYAQLGQYADADAEYKEAVRLRPDIGSLAEMSQTRLDQLKGTGAIR
jgi:predicted negative regulator of RcsB-dependent stress response